MEKDIELIERYLDGELSSAELKDFQERVQSDKELYNLLQFREKIQPSWQQATEFESTKTFLKKLHMNSESKKSTKNFYWAAAVGILLLAIPLVMRMSKSSNDSLQVNELEVKSSVEFLDDRYKQTYPVHGQIVKSGSIQFNWESALDVKTAIILTEIDSKEVYIISPLQSDQKQYLLKDTMPPGKYEWKMEGFKGSKMFVIK